VVQDGKWSHYGVVGPRGWRKGLFLHDGAVMGLKLRDMKHGVDLGRWW